MAVDTPATIAIVGAGPIGLEAALYARFLGYDVRVYERGRVVERLYGPEPADHTVLWYESTSALGRAALAAQRPDWSTPAPTARLSLAEVAEMYFTQLARSDLLADSVHTATEVLAIERDLEPDETVLEDEIAGFRLRVRAADGERIDTADVVFDASGSSSRDLGIAAGEADFYVLGSKGAQPAGDFTFAAGLCQIRDLLAVIADRPTLDLYATIDLPAGG